MYENVKKLEEAINNAVDVQSEEIYNFLSKYVSFKTINPKLTNQVAISIQETRDCHEWVKKKVE
ncbi:hypothetical protein RWE15_03415 [Virgibacillus halophilus]|uniref:Uncharacterized protein n=1 Tax=Tigheibacillus halophilus TaxID=361280 RepID=A0ABU5C2X2_9BACI|nr:hypothetical protein [Virgibacillus halophilus]